MLNTITLGTPSDQPPLLIAHGLFGSARNWGAVAKRLAATRLVTTVDMRNHGESFWADSHSYEDMSTDLAALLDRPTDILGHSMGGKTSMVLALTRPELVRKLVVADIAPVAYGHTQAPLIDAMRRLDLGAIDSRSDASDLLGRDIPDDAVRAFLLQSFDVKEKRWRLNLDALDAEMQKIMAFPDLSTPPFTGPTLFLTGANSDYVTRAHRPGIKALFPQARFAKIPQAGHWLHAENPRAFEAAVAMFLDH